MRRFLLTFLLVLAPTLGGMTPAEVEDTSLVKAMTEELNRSLNELSLKDFSKPYYVAYSVFEVDRVMCAARDGGIVQASRDEGRDVRIDLRVGDWSFDSGNTAFGVSGHRLMSLPTEDDYHAVRRQLWLDSDRAYKSAVQALEKKRAVINRLTESDEADIPNFTKVDPVRVAIPKDPQPLDEIDCKELARKVSAVFGDDPDIESGRVVVSARNVERFFVDTEGSLVYEPDTAAFVDVVGWGRAEDGMTVKDFFSHVAHDYESLPTAEALVKEARESVETLEKLQSSPKVDYYTGPVLFEPEAAAQLIWRLIARDLSGTPSPVSNAEGQSSDRNPLAARLGRQILPKEFDVVDDPTIEEFEGQPLLGSYAVDHEGVRAQKVQLVEDGMFESMLMSRTPRDEIRESNGHGRTVGGRVTGSVGNLVFKAEGGLSHEGLRDRLIEEAKKEGLDHAYVVRLFDNAAMTFDPFNPGSGWGGLNGKMTPLAIIRVNEDGSEEFVRGLSLKKPLIRDLERILAWGEEYDTTNYLVGNYTRVFYGQKTSPMPPVPHSITIPALLFEELDMPGGQSRFPKPPFLPAPTD